MLCQQGEQCLPGGAGRVALLAGALGARVSLAGVVGGDADGLRLRRLLADAGVQTEALLTERGRPTTAKQRFLACAGAAEVQLLPLDREDRSALEPESVGLLRQVVEQQVQECDALLVADHAKGACPPELLEVVLALAARRGIPALVDPARLSCLRRYDGAEALLPNRAEASLALGRELSAPEDGPEAARDLVEEAACRWCC